jgi:hypothetical protein
VTSVASPPGEVMPDAPVTRHEDGAWVLGALFAFALVAGAYFSFRFGGRWTEGDTAVMAEGIRAIVDQATILPNSPGLYPNGYTFGAVSAFLLAFTGLDAPTLLQTLYPLISAPLVLVAWPLYRELTGSSRGATLATLFLFIQPEFLFVILRGSHERVLRALILVALFLLIRSLRFADQPRTYASYVFLFYLTVYAIIATNSLFGSSFICALSLALVASSGARIFGPRMRLVSTLMGRRLTYVPPLSILLAYVFNAFVYPPAGNGISQVPDIFDRISRLLLTASPQTSYGEQIVAYDPYAEVLSQWIDIKVYFMVSVATYALIVASALVWFRLGLRWLAGAAEAPKAGQWMMWLLYAAFGVQGALSIVADRAGVLGGNLQFRSFPSFVMVAAPLVAYWLADWRPGRRARTIAAVCLAVLALLGLAKATNEPAVSNKWTFYLPEEVAAVRFTVRYSRDDGYWADYDDRLPTVQGMFAPPSQIVPFLGIPRTFLRLFLITDITRLRAARLGRPLPPAVNELRVYDNGRAQLYRIRARTPYQD